MQLLLAIAFSIVFSVTIGYIYSLKEADEIQKPIFD